MPRGLEVQDLHKRFGADPVLAGVTLAAPTGRITALFGQNGAGKTTLLKILMGVLAPDAGRATLLGEDILALPPQHKGAAGLGYLPQVNGSFPELTVARNLLAMLELHPLSREARQERLEELLALVGIEHLANRRYRHLSTGEARRLELAKAFICKPRILLLDEPFSGLDPCIVESLATILRDQAGAGMGILVTDHSAHTMVQVSDHAYLLAGGRIACQGTPREMLASEEAQRLYFGQQSYGTP